MKSKYGRWYAHPEVEKEKERHKGWKHICTEITEDTDTFLTYKCSCGIILSTSNFNALDLQTIYSFQDRFRLDGNERGLKDE